MNNIDILLINPPFHTRNGGGNFFPLGLGYIISSIKVYGYSYRVIDCTKMINSFFEEELNKFEEALLNELKGYTPLVIGIGPCITSQLRALKIISNCCKRIFPSIPTIAGGPLASIECQEWLFFDDLGINYLIKGDGELAIPNAIKSMKNNGNIENCKEISKRGYNYINRISDIDSIPFPCREIQNKNIFSTRRTGSHQAAMIASRGCSYACNYCVSGNSKVNKTVRKRSINNILKEMEELNLKNGIDDIVFYDDCFFNNIKTASYEIESFCMAFIQKDIQMTWQIELRPDLLCSLSDDSILLLENSGCRQINIGIEKISDTGLKFLGKASDINGLKQKMQHIKDISKIKLSATFILGGEAENRNDILQLVEASKTFGLDFAHYNPLFVYPGTPLYNDTFDNAKAWVNAINKDSLPWGEIVYENENLKTTDLLELVDYAYTEFYKNTEYAAQQMVIDRFNIKNGGEI